MKMKSLLKQFYKKMMIVLCGNIIEKRIKYPQKLIFSLYDAEYILKEKQSIKSINWNQNYIFETEKYDVSIIVPVYNGGKYLRECVESLIKQKTEYLYEIICIDDGSTDDSLEILNEYRNHKNVNIITQKNSGISATRNRGIHEAKGKYVVFVDNDDYLEIDFIQNVMDKAKENQADIVKCGYKVFGQTVSGEKDIIETEDTVYKNGLKENILSYSGYVWGCAVRKSLFDNICFPNEYWYEDMITRLLLYRKATVFVYIGKALYNHRFHGKNASITLWNGKNYKALEQLYLAILIAKHAQQLKLYYDEKIYRLYLWEMGFFLYLRIKRLERNVQKAAFIVASKFMTELSQGLELDDLSFRENALHVAFINQDYRLWETICKIYY